jgi:hypothetical protein
MFPQRGGIGGFVFAKKDLATRNEHSLDRSAESIKWSKAFGRDAAVSGPVMWSCTSALCSDIWPSRAGHNESGERFANVGTDHHIPRIFPPTVRAAIKVL